MGVVYPREGVGVAGSVGAGEDGGAGAGAAAATGLAAGWAYELDDARMHIAAEFLRCIFCGASEAWQSRIQTRNQSSSSSAFSQGGVGVGSSGTRVEVVVRPLSTEIPVPRSKWRKMKKDVADYTQRGTSKVPSPLVNTALLIILAPPTSRQYCTAYHTCTAFLFWNNHSALVLLQSTGTTAHKSVQILCSRRCARDCANVTLRTNLAEACFLAVAPRVAAVTVVLSAVTEAVMAMLPLPMALQRMALRMTLPST
jgi:hypothetical protein